MFRVAVGGVAIGHHEGLEIGHHGVAGGRFAADIGDRAGDQNRVDPCARRMSGKSETPGKKGE